MFRRSGQERDDEDQELSKTELFHVGVVTAAMLRFPDLADDESFDGQVYAKESDREIVNRKMRAVVRILSSKGVERAVLGAWGCGAYGNPVGEIVKAWKRVLLGPQKKSRGKDHGESRGKLKEIVFAIKDKATADRFAKAWGAGLQIAGEEESVNVDEEMNDGADELKAKIEELESQMTQTKFPMVKERLASIVIGLKEQLADRETEEEEELQEIEEKADPSDSPRMR